MRTDAELFQEYLKSGDRAALDNLFARHYPTVYHVVLKLVRNSADASDLTQATFLKALECARDGRAPRELRAWLLAVAINAVRQFKRGDLRRRREDWLFDACRRDLDSRAPSLDAERREFDEALEKALDAFPDDLAEPLVLHYYENLSYAQVGEILGLSKTTVQFRMSRAIDRLRDRFKSQGLSALASLIPSYFPGKHSSKPLLLGLTLMPVKKIAVALLILLAAAIAGRRAWIHRATPSDVARPGTETSKVTTPTRGPTTNDARNPAQAPGLFGTVLDARTRLPVAGALVSAYDLETAQSYKTLTDDRGAYRVSTPPSGTYHLKISAAGYATESLRAVRISTEPRDALLSRGGTIRGRVVHADGLAAGAARILAIHPNYGPGESFSLTQALYQQVLPREDIIDASTTANASDGTFELAHLPAGGYVLSVIAPDSAPFLFPDDLRGEDRKERLAVAEGSVRDVVVPLPPRGRVRFLVSDRSTHAPIPGALVTGIASIDRSRLPLEEFSFKTDAAGEAVLPAPLQERGTLDSVNYRVSCEGYGTQQSSFSGQENGYVVEIRLGKTARFEGQVQGPDGKPVDRCAIYVVGNIDGGVVDHVFTNAEGFYRTHELNAPQTFEVHLYDPGLARPRSITPVHLREGETRRLDFGRPGLAGIFGTVRRKGLPCARALICVDAKEGSRLRTVFYADAAGSFAIEGLAPGPYELFVNAGSSATGALSFKRQVTLAEGERREFRFDGGSRSIRGTVCDGATQAPLGKEDSIEIHARKAGSTDPAVTTESRDDGTFELLVEDAAIYEVEIADNDWRFYAGDRLRADLQKDPVVEGLRLLVQRDQQNRKIRLRFKDAESGEPVKDGSYHFQFRGGYGVGSLTEDGLLEDNEARIGTWKYKVEFDEYVPLRLTLELKPEHRELERSLELRKSDAVKVMKVQASSPAERAGLRAGDLIVACNGSRVPHQRALETICKSVPASQSVTLSVRRGATTLDVVVLDPDLGINGENGSQQER